VTWAVLDTNTVISALLFSGTTSELVPAWQSGHFQILVSRPIVEEYYRTLAYPKFKLTEKEIRSLIEEEVLPFTEAVQRPRKLRVSLRDPDDRKFLECAVAGRAGHVVSGDEHLLTLGSFRGIAIVPAAEYLEFLREK
jgi:putative PIN family toxin of toxin-antitoxin system